MSTQEKLSELVVSALRKFSRASDGHVAHQANLVLRQGFENASNFCYVNSVAQALMAFDPFVNLVDALRTFSPSLVIPQNGEALIPAIQMFVTMVDRIHQTKQGPINIRDLQVLAQSLLAREYRSSNGQEDVHELLTGILSSLHTEFEQSISQDLKRSSAPEVDEDGFMSPHRRGRRPWKPVDNPIEKLFQGKVQYTIYNCDNGNQVESTNNDTFFTLSLQPNSQGLVEALKQYCEESPIEGLKFRAHEKSLFNDLPECLIIQLKNFKIVEENGRISVKKLFVRTRIQLFLSIPSSCLAPSARDQTFNYRLFAIIYHKGVGVDSGHYFMNVFAKDSNQWMRVDDGKVTDTPVHEVYRPIDRKAVPFLLFYQRSHEFPQKSGNTESGCQQTTESFRRRRRGSARFPRGGGGGDRNSTR